MRKLGSIKVDINYLVYGVSLVLPSRQLVVSAVKCSFCKNSLLRFKTLF